MGKKKASLLQNIPIAQFIQETRSTNNNSNVIRETVDPLMNLT